MSLIDSIKGFFIRERIVARSMENPATPLSDPDQWVWDALGGGPSASGVTVNSLTAMRYSPVYRGVSLLARSVAKLPVHVYRRVGDGKERAIGHPAWRILKTRPNELVTSYKFKEFMMVSAVLRGNFYGYVFRGMNQSPESIVMLDPEKTKPAVEGGQLVYRTTIGGRDHTLDAVDVIHIRGLGHDGIVGQPLVAYAKDSLGLGMAAGAYGSSFFRNAARPSIAIEHPGRLSEKAAGNLKKSFNSENAGIGNQHRTIVLEEGAKVNPYSITQDEAQYLETRQFEIREVANWLGLPPHKLGDTTRTAYASLEMENQAFLDDSLDPWLVQIEEEFAAKLLTIDEIENDTHTISFMRSALLRADTPSRYAAYAVAITNGILTRNECRAMEDKNPIDGLDLPLVPLNMKEVGAEEEPPPEKDPPADGNPPPGSPPPPPPPEDEPPAEEEENDPSRMAKITLAHRGVLLEVTERMLRRLAKGARQAAKDPDTYLDWVGAIPAEHGAAVQRATTYAVEAWRSVAPHATTPDALLEKIMAAAESTLGDCASVTPKRLGEAVDGACRRLEAEIPGQIVDEYLQTEVR